MQRLLVLFLSLAALATPTRAQPSPGSPAGQPPNPPADQPPAASASPTETPPPPAEMAPPPSVAPAPVAPPAKPAEDAPRKLSVGKDSPGAFFSPGLLMQGWFVWDNSTKKATSGDVDFSTTTFRIRRLEISAGGEM